MPGIQQVRRTHCERGAHLRRMNSLRLTAKEDETVHEVDLSRKYFSSQVYERFVRQRS